MKAITVALYGVTKDEVRAKTHQAKEVVAFVNDARTIRVIKSATQGILLVTKTGTYPLVAHENLNIFMGTAQATKVHFSKKKIVGKLIYWA